MSPAAGMRGLEAAQPPRGLAGWRGWHGVFLQTQDTSAPCKKKKKGQKFVKEEGGTSPR